MQERLYTMEYRGWTIWLDNGIRAWRISRGTAAFDLKTLKHNAEIGFNAKEYAEARAKVDSLCAVDENPMDGDF
jgi:hypothetical protein